MDRIELQPLKESNRSKHLSKWNILIQYTKDGNWIVIGVGMVFALLHGACFPLITLIFGHMTDILLSEVENRCKIPDLQHNSSVPIIDLQSDAFLPIEDYFEANISSTDFLDIFGSYKGKMSKDDFEHLLSLLSAGIAVFVLISAFVQTYCWESSSGKQTYKIRRAIFNKLLYQDISWYEKNKNQEIVTHIFKCLECLEYGTGNKLGMLLQYLSTCVSGLLVALTANWRLTVFIFPFLVLCFVGSHIVDKINNSGSYEVAVKALLQDASIKKGSFHLHCYNQAVKENSKTKLHRFSYVISAIVVIYMLIYGILAIVVWQNWKLIQEECIASGSVATVFYSVVVGVLSINKIMHFTKPVVSAMRSAETVVEILNHFPPSSKEATNTAAPRGQVKIQNVSVSSTGDLSRKVLDNVNFEIHPGQKAAILDVNGQASRTVMDLLLGICKPTIGKVLIDGYNNSSNTTVGFIGSEPGVLSGLTVLENIQFSDTTVQFDNLIKASKATGLHGYIPRLALGYDTLVDEDLIQELKYHIILTRILISNPSLLVIDDYDNATKDLWQINLLKSSFQKAMLDRTMFMRCHSIPLIQSCHVILVLMNGTLSEFGSHKELAENGTIYQNFMRTHKLILQNKNEGTNAAKKHFEASSITEAKRRDIKNFTKNSHTGIMQLIHLNSSEWLWITTTLLSSICIAISISIFALLYGSIFVPSEERPQRSQLWSYMVLIIACVAGISFWLQEICGKVSSEKLFARLQTQICIACDNEQQQQQNLYDLKDLRPVMAARFCEAIGYSVSLASSMLITFLYGWKMALVLLFVFPSLAAAFHFKSKTVNRYLLKHKDLLQPAYKIMNECLKNIRTIKAWKAEHMLEKIYCKKLVVPYQTTQKFMLVYAAVFALAESGLHVLYAATFKFGFFLIRSDSLGLVSVYRIFFALAVCIISMSHLLVYKQEWVCATRTARNLSLYISESLKRNA